MLSTHSDLLTAVSDYIGARSDLGSVDDDFVVLCEARLNYGSLDNQFPTPALRVRQMETRATATATSEYVALPDNFLEAKYLKVTSSTPEVRLKAMTSGMFDTNLNNNHAGVPRFYDIVGEEFRLNPVPSSVTLECLYYRTIPALTSTNWLLTANPALYLYGCLLEAAIYVDEVEDIAKYGRMFSGLVLGMNASGSDSSRAQPFQTNLGVPLLQTGTVRI